MLLKRNDETASKYAVFDACGQQLPYVMSYDTETKEVEMYLKLQDEESSPNSDERYLYLIMEEDKPFLAKFILPGSYAVDEQGNILK